ncbi:MAG: TonB-dependent receptor plug domain-containing protein [Sulfuricurvum sp.]|uniref:TonB-dependent receptor plug domain-containing protein n=1 Tax=Sulfuricurvum sp. TaxID=2025608 RepID=UPI0026302863|nr:TonB-dependent receptor plug domain-containing protein [Sulfuricurvum sp.]MDD2830242.1 TonB-dependent receptor plug domain-containing protein [Sulfuricurvum sp.]MDD4948800.1 TonB-dependent receptor plug domain-containing protein [Sulfuricurvum sp.]
MKQQTLFSLLAATLLASSLQANETAALEPVKVTASEIHERDDIKLDSPTNLYRVEKTAEAGTQVFTKADIDAYAPKDFFDLMDKAVGLDLTYQGRKSPFFLNMRGGGNITYIIDGAILPSTSNRILQKIPMSAIEEIQVIRGSTALYLGPSIGIGASNSGSGINTGFIVIRTKQPKKTEGLISAYAEKAGDHPSANGENIFVGTHLGSVESGFSGYIGGLVSRYDRPSQDTWFDGSDAQSGMITGGVTFGRFNINLMGYKDEGRFEMQRGVTVTGALDNSKWYYDPINTKIISSDMGMQWSESQNTLFSIFSTQYNQKEIAESFANNSHSEKTYEEKTNGYSLRHSARFGDTLIQLGGQSTNSKGFGPNLSSSYNRFDTSVLGWSASIEQKLFGGDVILDAGYRQDQKHINNSSTSTTKDSANNDVDMAPARVIALGALWNITPMFSLNGRYFQGTEGTGGDFDLKTQDGSVLHAEKQKRTEIALEAKIASYFKPTLTWFNVDFNNQKSASSNTYTDTDGNIYYYYTEADSLRRGIELAFKGKSNGFDYLIAWTHMTDISTTNVSGVTTDYIAIENPEDSFTGKVGYTWNNYRANISAKRVSEYHQSTSAMGTAYAVNLGDYTRVDANIAGDFKLSNLTFTAKLYGRNLGDEQYATRYTTGYYYDRGRTLGLELSMAF